MNKREHKNWCLVYDDNHFDENGKYKGAGCNCENEPLEEILKEFYIIQDLPHWDNTDKNKESILHICRSYIYKAYTTARKETVKEVVEICDDAIPYYCTSGCGCKYPTENGRYHEYDCVWKEDKENPVYDVIQQIKGRSQTLINLEKLNQ